MIRPGEHLQEKEGILNTAVTIKCQRRPEIGISAGKAVYKSFKARMHDDPKRGVVDANSCVHGIGNLYVAGSSVFPTSGWANPVLTTLALTMRLADHLTVKLEKM